ncbi:MAG: c-type cytochrome [Chitinophagaceae bacterium]|nr:c-type cytochrome [Chitinophagaceae bacterium]
MKRSIIVFVAASLLMACGGSSSKEKTASTKTGDVSQNPDYQNGLALVTKSDCLTCHKIDEKVTGPSYRDIANKYGDMPDTIISHLAGKVISGGTGTWGQVFMTPHPNLSQADAEAMVKYILLLKNK